MLPGPTVDRHHWVPRSKGGRTTAANVAWLHRVCHRKIHAELTEADLAAGYASPQALRAHPGIARFLRWVARRPATLVDWHHAPRRR